MYARILINILGLLYTCGCAVWLLLLDLLEIMGLLWLWLCCVVVDLFVLRYLLCCLCLLLPTSLGLCLSFVLRLRFVAYLVYTCCLRLVWAFD